MEAKIFTKEESILDIATGEIIARKMTKVTAKEAGVAPVSKIYNYGHYLKRAVTALSEDPDLTHLATKIILFMLGQLTAENIVVLKAPLLAKHFKVSRQHILSNLSLLVRKNIILKVDTNLYQLNPRIGWIGRFDEEMCKYPEIRNLKNE